MDWKKSVQKATALTIETKDYVSYCTMIEMLLEQNLTHKEEDRLDLLCGLHEELQKPEHEELTKEIAWDVLGMLLPFVSDNSSKEATDFAHMLAEKGNPKEVFLKSNEILTSTVFKNLSQLKVTVDSMNSAMNRIETNRPLAFLDNYIVSLCSSIARVALVKEINRLDVWIMSLDSMEKMIQRFGRYPECHQNIVAAFTIFAEQFFSSERLCFSFRELLRSNDPHVQYRNNRVPYDVQQLHEMDSFLIRFLDVFDGLGNMRIDNWGQLTKHFYDVIMNPDDTEGSIFVQKQNEEEQGEGDFHQKVMVDIKGCIAMITIRSYYRERNFLEKLVYESKRPITLKSIFTLISIEGNSDTSCFIDLALYQSLLLFKFIVEHSTEDRHGLFSLLQIYQYFSAFNSEPWIRLIANDIVFHLLDPLPLDTRFEYVLDTLEECPFLNVKASILNYYQKNGVLSKPADRNPFLDEGNIFKVISIIIDDLSNPTTEPLLLIYLQQALIFIYYMKFQNRLDYNDQVHHFLQEIETFIQENEEKDSMQNFRYYLDLLQQKK
ncbi:central kinetochore associated family protein [Schizosaccharomyces octosporus yFS286]|uniref:Central kinetochore associated family protein n=1 Tax=Schizosaccharomyces octosporus (strain yFS286) TaxID=483514 RepID=S9QX10_SCHOY|nr:central kinetochore associated family protein [Schizosaccharomyces octosporus yFS286]EPX70860.1 central kinetochore associated family protein [Schizosaccharomyces octosporus yFS286]